VRDLLALATRMPSSSVVIGRNFPRWRLAIALLILPELTALSLPLPVAYLGDGWWLVLFSSRRMIAAILLATTFAALLLSWGHPRDLFGGDFGLLRDDDPGWSAWLTIHLVTVAAMILWGWMVAEHGALIKPNAELWALSGILLTSGLLVSWCASVMPPRLLFRWLKSSPAVIVAALILGFAARFSEFLTMRLWSILSNATLFGVAAILNLTRQDVLFQPDQSVVGTSRFAVTIDPGCSGLEGVGLIVVMTSLYLWTFRAHLRFPQALTLLPVGMLLIEIFNIFRISILIEIGQRWPTIAMDGFHTVAGWILFNAVAFVLIIASQRSSVFARVSAAPAAVSAACPELYLTPLLAIIAVSMITRIFSDGFDLLYPLRVLAAVAALWIYRGKLRVPAIRPSLWTIGLGTAAFVLWILLTPVRGAASADASFAAGLNCMTRLAASGWLAFRIMGAVITGPIAEELAFRGYVLRKLVCGNFETVSYRHFTWVSFIGSSALFAATHREWLAAFTAGAIFAVAAYRSGRLSDAVIAHATANGLLAAWVLSTHRWSLWS
jgi:exosortase E/protease (VPEID-CTERM system)